MIIFLLNLLSTFFTNVSRYLISKLPRCVLYFLRLNESHILHTNPVLLTEIMKHLELKDIALFRGTCHAMHDLLENVSVRKNNNSISISFYHAQITVEWKHENGTYGVLDYSELGDWCRMEFKSAEMNESGELVERNAAKNWEHGDMYNLALFNLEFLLQQQGVELKNLLIQQNYDTFNTTNASAALRFLRDLGNYMAEKTWKLQVGLLRFSVLDQTHVMALLPCLHRRIERLEIRFIGYQDRPIEEINEIVATEQWANLQDVAIETSVDTQLVHFHHIPNAAVEIASITLDDLIHLKNRFCENPATMENVFISCRNFDDQGDPQLSPLGQLEREEGDERRWRSETATPRFFLRITHYENVFIFLIRRNR